MYNTLRRFSLAELQLLICAYSYEVLSTPLMSDFTYDMIAKDLEVGLKGKLKEFEAYTGSWIEGQDPELLKELRQLTTSCIPHVGTGDVLHHTIIEKVSGLFQEPASTSLLNIEDLIAFDVETAGSQPNYALQPWRAKYHEMWIRTYAIAYYQDKKIVTKGWVYNKENLSKLLIYIASKNKIVVGWNIPYDVACLQAEGLLEETRRIKWLDGMILWKNLDRTRKVYGLKEAVAKFLPQFAGYEDGVDFEGDIEKLLEYNQLDSRFAFWLTMFLWKQLTPREQNAIMIDMADIAEVAYANLRGVQISIQAVKEAAAFAIKQRNENYAKILPHLPQDLDKHGNLKFNLDSDQQIADLLFNKWGLPVFKRTPKLAPSVDKESLLELAHLDERAKWIQQYRETTGYLSKCVNAVVESLKYNKSPADPDPKPIVHPELRKAGTYTDRCTYSSSQDTEKKKRKKVC